MPELRTMPSGQSSVSHPHEVMRRRGGTTESPREPRQQEAEVRPIVLHRGPHQRCGFDTGINTCYRGAVFQILMVLLQVRNFLQDYHGLHYGQRHHGPFEATCLACGLLRLYAEYWDQSSSDAPQYLQLRVNQAAKALYDLCVARGWHEIDRDEQQDADEFLNWIIHTIWLETFSISDDNSNLGLVWKMLLYPKWTYVITCPDCGNQTEREDQTCSSLSLQLDFRLSLQEMVDTHLKNGIREDWTCGNCKKKHDKLSERTYLRDIPDVLFMHTNNFTYNQYIGGWMPNRAAIPWNFHNWTDKTVIDATRHLSPSLPPPTRPLQYRLQGVILNSGRSATAGHYIAYTTTDGENWYLFDDEKVYPASFDEIRRAGTHPSFRGYVFAFTRMEEVYLAPEREPSREPEMMAQRRTSSTQIDSMVQRSSQLDISDKCRRRCIHLSGLLEDEREKTKVNQDLIDEILELPPGDARWSRFVGHANQQISTIARQRRLIQAQRRRLNNFVEENALWVDMIQRRDGRIDRRDKRIKELRLRQRQELMRLKQDLQSLKTRSPAQSTALGSQRIPQPGIKTVRRGPPTHPFPQPSRAPVKSAPPPRPPPDPTSPSYSPISPPRPPPTGPRTSSSYTPATPQGSPPAPPTGPRTSSSFSAAPPRGSPSAPPTGPRTSSSYSAATPQGSPPAQPKTPPGTQPPPHTPERPQTPVRQPEKSVSPKKTPERTAKKVARKRAKKGFKKSSKKTATPRKATAPKKTTSPKKPRGGKKAQSPKPASPPAAGDPKDKEEEKKTRSGRRY